MTVDEVSILLGELKAEMSESHRQREAMFHKLDCIEDKMVTKEEFTRHMAEEISARQLMTDRLVECTVGVSDWKETKKRGIWALLGITMAGGAGGGSIASWFKHILSP